MENTELKSTASAEIDTPLYEEIMRERCGVQGHTYWPVTVWGGSWQHVTRRSYRQCEWCGVSDSSTNEEEDRLIAEYIGDGCCGGGIGQVPYPGCVDCPRRGEGRLNHERAGR